MDDDNRRGWKPNIIWGFFKHNVVQTVFGLVLGAAASWFISEHYYQKSLSIEVKAAKKEGRIAGIAEGVKQGTTAIEQKLPELLNERYPQALETVRKLGFEEGHNRGREEGFADGKKAGLSEGNATGERVGFEQGKAIGRTEGLREGHESAAAACNVQRSAESSWRDYAVAVTKAADRAEALGPQKGKPEFDGRLYSLAPTIVYNAHVLNDAYKDKASAFNSIVEQINAALKRKDTEAVRLGIIALRESLPVKADRFFSADKRIETASSNLANAPLP